MTEVQSESRTLAERALAALELSPDGILLVDRAGRIALANASAASWLGDTAGRLRDCAVDDLIHDRLEMADDGSTPRMPEVGGGVHVRPTGSPETVLEWRVTATDDGTVHTFRDMTAAQTLLTATAEFAATISHDLRLPITVALGYAQGLRKRQGGDERDARELDAIVTASRRLNAMLTQAVDALRLQTGIVRIGHGPVDLGALARSALTKARRLHPEAAFDEDLAEVPLTDGDQSRLEQVIVTLLANAARHGQAPRRLRVAAEGDCIIVEVADAGPGMDREQFERLLAPGRRPDGATRGADGLGIGVSNAAQIVDRLGGELTIESAAGHGTIARVTLPIVDPVDLD